MTGARRHAAGLLLLRLVVGGLMLFHGVHKLRHGIGWLPGALQERGLPGWLAFGVYLGEVVAPLCLIFGWLYRSASVLLIATMVVAVYVKHPSGWMTLGKHGQWGLELQAFYALGALCIVLLGPGPWRLPSPIKRLMKS